MDNKGAGIFSFLEENTTNTYLVYNLMLVLIVFNLLGLVPGSMISGTSIPRLVFIRLVIFISNIIFAFISDIEGYMVMFVPRGAPIILLPLLYVIEIVSYLIRPIALVIRICVNIFCGHILLLLSGFSRMILVLFIVILLEFRVAIVQGYVYSIILML